MGRKFDLAAAFTAAVGEVSDLDTREQLQYIPLDKLDQDPGNFYSLDGVEELAANIQLCGLQQPLRVREGEHGRYTIVSGHRRRAALALLAEEAAGLDDQTPLHLQDYRPELTVEELRDYAAGEFRERYFYGNDLAPRSFSDPAGLARTLRCSADYVLELTEELRPAGTGEEPWHWWPEEPEESGLYWCVTGPLHRGGGLYWWNQAERQWEDPAAGGFGLHVAVKLWMPCPALPESMAWTRTEA